jgi:putative selenium metabolism protein SsnA
MLITHAKIVPWTTPNTILDDGAILIADGLIHEIGPTKELVSRHPAVETFDAQDRYVLPGSICAHTHFYGAFARGMAIPGTPPRDFPSILSRLWWPLDKSLAKQDIRSSALVCLIDAIRHGTTTLFDHHASANSIGGSLDTIAAAVLEAGVRCALCYEVSDRDGPQKAEAGIQENLAFLAKAREHRPLLAAAFGLHASLSLSDQTLDRCRSLLPEGSGFHIHAAESDADQFDSMTRYGMRVVNRLHQHGILGPASILAHCVRVDEREIDLLAETGTWVTHQPRSNMNNGVGVAPVEAMLKAGVRLALGNDGFSNAMWEEWKTTYLLHKAWHRDPSRMSGLDVKRLAVDNNASLAAQYFGIPIGRIEPGAAADLMFVDYQPFTEVSGENIVWHILFGFQDHMVTSTIVNGKFLMKDHELLTLDEEKIARTALGLSKKTWKRYQELVQ